MVLPEYFEDFNVACYEEIADAGECAVCLCKIDGDDEVRELRCDHFSHRVCLDRWLGMGYGLFTCPVCRNELRMPPSAAELHREVVLIDFHGAASYGDRDQWWLR
ncbi:hypothetical protein C2S51_028297 [Perilla frutescens var. frutescens]|nr:hypothetical protein C2S51_028297 [Perilla frutescens var. frutescens]